jgi:hypothetical protein
MKLSRLWTIPVVMPLLFVVLLAGGVGFGYYKHREISERILHKIQNLTTEETGVFSGNTVGLGIYATDNLLDIRRISVKRFSVTDSHGTQCPWKSEPWGNSEIGPGLGIEVDAHGAKDVLTASGLIRYKGRMYSIEQQWQEKPAWWAPGAMDWYPVYRKIRPEAGTTIEPCGIMMHLP